MSRFVLTRQLCCRGHDVIGSPPHSHGVEAQKPWCGASPWISRDTMPTLCIKAPNLSSVYLACSKWSLNICFLCPTWTMVSKRFRHRELQCPTLDKFSTAITMKDITMVSKPFCICLQLHCAYTFCVHLIRLVLWVQLMCVLVHHRRLVVGTCLWNFCRIGCGRVRFSLCSTKDPQWQSTIKRCSNSPITQFMY